MIDWKIIIAVFLAIITLTTGLVESVFSGDIIERVKEVTNNIVGDRDLPDLFSMPVDKNISISGDFGTDNYSLVMEDIPIKNLRISFESQDSDIVLGSQVVDSSKMEESNLSVKGFDGKVEVNAAKSIVKISGKAEETSVNEVSLKSEERTPIETDYIKYEVLVMDGLETKELSLKNLEGKLTVKDKIMIKIEKEPIKLNSYEGNFLFNRTHLSFEGFTNRILLSGEDIRSTISS
ncbi:MAG: hypothetical protein ABEK36_03770 [Candidatus Aenigmatarchaeota archaeon]